MNKQSKIFQNILLIVGIGIFASVGFDAAIASGGAGRKKGITSSLKNTSKYHSSRIEKKNGQVLLNSKALEKQEIKKQGLASTLKKVATESKENVCGEDDSNPPSIDSVNPNSLSINSVDSDLYKKSSISEDAGELTKTISGIKDKVLAVNEDLKKERNMKRDIKGSRTGPLGPEKPLQKERGRIEDVKKMGTKTGQLLASIEDVSGKVTDLVDNLPRIEQRIRQQVDELKKIEDSVKWPFAELKEMKEEIVRQLNNEIVRQLNNEIMQQLNEQLLEQEKRVTDSIDRSAVNLANIITEFTEEIDVLRRRCNKLAAIEENDLGGQESDLTRMETLLKENQELKEKVEKLESQNTEYEGRFKLLTKQIEELSNQIKALNPIDLGDIPFFRKGGKTKSDDQSSIKTGDTTGSQLSTEKANRLIERFNILRDAVIALSKRLEKLEKK